MIIDLKTSQKLLVHLDYISGNLDKNDHKNLLHNNEELLRYLTKLHEQATRDFHPTEEKYPEQCKMFRDIIERMYSVHLDKNQDYSPMNIIATGIVGLATRIWDKTARICNLLGFDLQTGVFDSEKKNANEPLEDSFTDLAVYCIIALIYRAGKWGK